MKNRIFVLGALIFALVLSGCVTAKVVERERVDQDISGNQGYIMGNAPTTGDQTGPSTRQFIKVDVELPPYKTQKEQPDKDVWGNQGYINRQPALLNQKPTVIFPSRPSMVEEEGEYVSTKASVTKTKPTLAAYKVKKNDSLWKIAKRADVYGNGNKWRKIYEANKDKIKNPNKLRPGIVLVIPQD